jgi:hypothetical protein
MARNAEKRPASLFHAIVVVGAALGAGAGCGNDEAPPPDAPQVADANPAPDSPAGTPDAAPADGPPADAMIIIL